MLLRQVETKGNVLPGVSQWGHSLCNSPVACCQLILGEFVLLMVGAVDLQSSRVSLLTVYLGVQTHCPIVSKSLALCVCMLEL